MQLTDEEIRFFAREGRALPLYAALREKLPAACPEVVFKVQKTQISLYTRHMFACASLPYRRFKGRPEVYFVLTLLLPYRLESERIEQCVQPYPNRWTHHLIVSDSAQIDGELLSWLKECYDFSLRP